MTSSRFDSSSTSKTLNLSLLLFNERSGSENLGSKFYINLFAGLNKNIVYFQIKKLYVSEDGFLLLNAYPIGGFLRW